jgi:hypothetical protein
LDVEIGFFDHSSGPNGRQDLVFRNQFASPADQQREKIERSGAECDRCGDPGVIHPAQTPGATIEPKALKVENVNGTEVHALAPLQLSARPEDIALGFFPM